MSKLICLSLLVAFTYSLKISIDSESLDSEALLLGCGGCEDYISPNGCIKILNN